MKNFFLKFLFVFFLFGIASIQAQYTDIINSNKPGFSEGPYGVGMGVYQFESDIFFKNTSVKPTFSQPESFGVDLLFRTSFFLEKLELNTQLTYQTDKIVSQNGVSSGLSKFIIGAKYLLFQPEYTDKTKEIKSWKRRNAFDRKRLIPSVGAYFGVNTDFLNTNYKTSYITPKIGFLFQHNLTNDFNVITNIYYDKIGTSFSEFSYIITATQNLSYSWSGFLETQRIFQESQNDINLGIGAVYLFSKDFQANASVRSIKEGGFQGVYGSLGISYRIDKHATFLKELKEKEISTIISRYNKRQNNFFNRLFRIFKKKKKSTKRKKLKRRRKGTATKNPKNIFSSSEKNIKIKTKKEETELEKLEREIKELEEELK